MPNMNLTFWRGKHGKILTYLHEDIPWEGRVKNYKKRKFLEQWRCLNNAYYRFYNDGDHPSKIRRYFELYGIEYPSKWDGEDIIAYRLEELAEQIFVNALIEKTNVELEKKA